MNKQERGKTCWKVEAWHLRRSVFPSTQGRILQRQHVLLDEEQRKFHFGAAWTGLFSCVWPHRWPLYKRVVTAPDPCSMCSMDNDISLIYSCIISAGHVASPDKTQSVVLSNREGEGGGWRAGAGGVRRRTWSSLSAPSPPEFSQ